MASTKGDPTTEYIRKSAGGGGKSSVVRGSQKGITFGAQIDGDKSVGTKRFDVTSKSLNRGRKM